jgi:CRP/FNR family transcriptional regulator, cyclic AMP receptor protein
MAEYWSGAMPGLDVEEVLPPALADTFAARAVKVRARKGQMLIMQGSAADEVYLILQGQVRVSVFSANGRETVLRDMGPGRLLGELAAISALPRSATVAAIEPTSLAVVTAAAFRSFLHDVPGAGYWLAVQLAARVRNLTEKSSELASLPVAARIVSELLRLADRAERSGDTARITRFPTHADIAASTGTHREAVTRELRQLARNGLLVQSGRQLQILSLSGLAAERERQSQ